MGTEVWTDQFDTPFPDHAYAVTTDGTGVYVAGYTESTLSGQSSAGGRAAFVKKYDAS